MATKTLDFNRYRAERKEPDPITFEFGYYPDPYRENPNLAGKPRRYSIYPKLSFVMTKMLSDLDAYAQGLTEEDFKSALKTAEIMNRAGDILGELLGHDAWKQLLADDFDVETAFALLEAIGNEHARTALAEAPEGEREGPSDAEPDPAAAPGAGEGDSAPKSVSPETTSSGSGEPLRPMPAGFTALAPTPSSG